jgi:hypothetical protein
MGFCDDLSPIQLSGTYIQDSQEEQYAEQSSVDVFSFSYGDDQQQYYDTNENAISGSYSLQDEDFNEPSLLASEQSDDGLMELTNTGEESKISGSLSESEIADDLAQISKDSELVQKEYSAAKEAEKDDFIKTVLDKNKEQAKEANTNTEASQPTMPENKQSIFDAIAKSMNYANAFDLGDYVLEQRFNMFDAEENKKKWNEPVTEDVTMPESKSIAPEPSTQDFVEDLDIMQAAATEPVEESKTNMPGETEQSNPILK